LESVVATITYMYGNKINGTVLHLNIKIIPSLTPDRSDRNSSSTVQHRCNETPLVCYWVKSLNLTQPLTYNKNTNISLSWKTEHTVKHTGKYEYNTQTCNNGQG